MEWKGDGWRCTVAYRVDRGCLLIICYASRRVARDCYRPRSRLGTEMDTEKREPIGRLDVEELGVERIQAWLSIGGNPISRFDRRRKVVDAMESWLVGQIGISLVNASVCVLN